MDFNNFPSQSSQLIDPTQQPMSTSQASLYQIQALVSQNADANITVDANGSSDGICSEASHETDKEQTDEEEIDQQREQFNLQIQQSALNPSWATFPNTNACVVSFGREEDDVVEYADSGEFAVGQSLSSKKDLQNAVKQYSISRNYKFVVKESKSDKYIVECKKKEHFNCPWHLRAVKQFPHSDEFIIVRYPGQHTCSAELGEMNHVNLTSDYISQQILEMVRTDTSMKVKLIRQLALETWGYDISYRKAWIAKQKAVEKIYGDWDESYHLLQRWVVEMQRANPGSVVEWCTRQTDNPAVVVFQRVFWAFRRSILGFGFCRPLIIIDSTPFIYGKYKGSLFVAMAVDANNHLFPLAFAVVEGENNSSWGWFLACLRHYIVKKDDGICVISDRHASILHAMTHECPGWIHRYCIRHLGSNIGTHYRSVFRGEFKKVAHQRQLKKFQKYWTRLISNSDCKGIDDYLTGQAGPMEAWSIHFDGGHRYGVVSSNHAQAYNAIMRDTRALPIAALVQFTFYKTNSWLVERAEMAQQSLLTGADYPQHIQLMLHKNLVKRGYHKFDMFDRADGVFSVSTKRGNRTPGKGGNVQVVHLRNQECSCSKWQIYRIPCSHVLCVCRKQNLNIAPFIGSCYRIDNYLATYEKSFRPIPDEAYWSEYNRPKCIPDLNRLCGKGRPKSTRFKNKMDEVQAPSASRQKCGSCGQKGHNKRKCSSRAGTSS